MEIQKAAPATDVEGVGYQRAASLADLPPGTVMEVTVGEQAVALCNVGGQIHALSGTCPHRGAPLGQGALHGATLVCPWHAWEFDCLSGQLEGNAGIKLEKYPVKVEADTIYVNVGV